jgi:hypothetical protein
LPENIATYTAVLSVAEHINAFFGNFAKYICQMNIVRRHYKCKSAAVSTNIAREH